MYNGYNFLEFQNVYNPWLVVNHLNKNKFFDQINKDDFISYLNKFKLSFLNYNERDFLATVLL